MQENKLTEVLEEAKKQLMEATDMQAAEDLRVKMLGKKGAFTTMLRSMSEMSKEQRKEFGKAANMAKAEFERMLNERKEEIRAKAREAALKAERIDVTEPGREVKIGVQHPITQTINEIAHPARDKTDTFYVDEDIVLRPHTSSCEPRAVQGLELPYKIISPGRCFRCDTPDATHSHTFHQIEMMVVGEGVTMADLKGSLDLMAKRLFGPETRTKFRPHHFPFTEPSAEMDVSCFKCGGRGCNVCKGSGWIEILGCGMTHPHVHKVGNIDTEKYTGFAVGMGVERIAMLKYGIDDIRLLYENDKRFIEQFK